MIPLSILFNGGHKIRRYLFDGPRPGLLDIGVHPFEDVYTHKQNFKSIPKCNSYKAKIITTSSQRSPLTDVKFLLSKDVELGIRIFWYRKGAFNLKIHTGQTLTSFTFRSK